MLLPLRYRMSPPPLHTRFTRREAQVLGYVDTLSLLLSSWAKFVPGHVRPCVHPVATMYARDRWSTIVGYAVHLVATAIAVGYVSTWIMFARVYTRSRLLSP